MGKYSLFKQSLKEKRRELSIEIENYEFFDKKERRFNKISNELSNKTRYIIGTNKDIKNLLLNNDTKIGSNKAHYDKLLSLKAYYPDSSKLFDAVETMSGYDFLLVNMGVEKSNLETKIYDKMLEYQRSFGIPKEDSLMIIKALIEQYNRATLGGKKGIASMVENAIKKVFSDVCIDFIEYTLKIVKERIKDEKKKIESINKSEIEEKIKLIDKYIVRFSDDKLVKPFDEQNELAEFEELVHLVIKDYDECEKILYSVKDELPKEEIVNDSFEYLNLSDFTEEEQQIIEKYRELVEDPELINGDFVRSQTPYITSRVEKWHNEEDILYFLNLSSFGLKTEEKDYVIKIYKIIIDAYKDYSDKKLRQARIDELNKLDSNFQKIIVFIKLTSSYHYDNNPDIKEIENYIDEINSFYLPYETGNEFDDDLDNEVEEKIVEYKGKIKKWKKEMTAYYSTDTKEEDNIAEYTDNLVFCLTDDIDLSEDGFAKEYLGAVCDLESKSSQQLKCPSGRKAMAKIRKTNKKGDEVDFIKFLEDMHRKKQIKFRFVPYRYSSSHDYRTGLIKFEPSSIVKKHLDERYNLQSNQSAYYGIFMIVPVIGVNHSEYSRFEKYITDNSLKIEELAELFSSENPNYEELDRRVDSMLGIKKDLTSIANKNILAK